MYFYLYESSYEAILLGIDLMFSMTKIYHWHILAYIIATSTVGQTNRPKKASTQAQCCARCAVKTIIHARCSV